MHGTQRKSASGSRNGSGDDVRNVLDSIRRIVRLLRLGSRDAERKVGLSGAQLFVLQKLAESGMLSVNDLAERTHTHQSSVSVVAQSLVEKGLVARARATDDARRLELTLTPSARALLRKAPGAAQDRLVAAMEAMPAAARRQLAQGLQKLVENAGLSSVQPVMLFTDGPAPKVRPGRRNAGHKKVERNGR